MEDSWQQWKNLLPLSNRRGRPPSTQILSWPPPALLYGDPIGGGNRPVSLETAATVGDIQEEQEWLLAVKGSRPLPDESPSKRKAIFIEHQQTSYLVGWRLALMIICLSLGVFIITLEATIVSTSLITITKDLGNQNTSGWINTSYLLGLAGLVIITSKLSDIFGQKTVLAVSLFIVTVAASACGAAQTMQQLIIFRALQGIGAAGIDSMYQVILRRMVPIAKYPLYGGIIATIFIGSGAIGPLLGGFINDHSTWRWAFWINIPVGCISFSLLILSLPSGFPHNHRRGQVMVTEPKSIFRRLDFGGAVLMIGSALTLVFALEEGGSQYSWSSPAIITAFIASGILCVVFIFWEKRTEVHSKGVREPVFPRRLSSNRFLMGLVLTSFLSGAALMSAIINIPQKFQLVNGMMPSGAGIRLLPFVLCTPVAAVLSGWVVSLQKIPHIYVLYVGGALSTLGMQLMSTLSVDDFNINPAQYFYQTLLGLGLGTSVSALSNVVTGYVEAQDLAVALGAVNQFRFLGGAVGLAICSTLLKHQTKDVSPNLATSQTAGQAANANSVYEFKHAHAVGYHLQTEFLAYLCVLSLVSLLLLVERKPRAYI